jgi:hypothetical protein
MRVRIHKLSFTIRSSMLLTVGVSLLPYKRIVVQQPTLKYQNIICSTPFVCSNAKKVAGHKGRGVLFTGTHDF